MAAEVPKALRNSRQLPSPGWPARIPKTAEIVADHFRAQIVRGELKEGDFLPPEGQLIESLGISRPTLREAFRIIEAENLISVVRGSRTGARVHKPKIEGVSRYAAYVLQAEGATIADMFEARLAIEPYVVRQLALKKNRKSTARLRQEVERLNVLAKEGRFLEFIAGTAEFHRVLVEVGGNRTLQCMIGILQDLLTRYQLEVHKSRPQPAESQRAVFLRDGVKSYTKLIDLIEAGDAAAAVAHWELHVVNANKVWAAGVAGSQVIDAFA